MKRFIIKAISTILVITMMLTGAHIYSVATGRVSTQSVEPELVALGTTIIDNKLGFIYGLPHGDIDGVTDLVDDGYVKVVGDGSVVCTPVDGQKLLGTGAKIELKDSTGAIVKTYYVVIFGDADGDSFITSEDAIDVMRWYAWIDCENDYGDSSIPASFAMDINEDGCIDVMDYAMVNCYYAGLIDDIPQNR